MLYLKTGSSFSIWNGEPINNIQYPTNIEVLWSNSDLAAINLYAPAPADPLPNGKYIVSVAVQTVNNVVKFVNTLASETPQMVADRKAAGYLQITSLANVLTSGILNGYPDGEKQLWLRKETEARSFLGIPEANRTANDAPILAMVCKSQFGTQNTSALISSITSKATNVVTKANQWLYISTLIEGFRSKYQVMIDGASTEIDVKGIIDIANNEMIQTKVALGI